MISPTGECRAFDAVGERLCARRRGGRRRAQAARRRRSPTATDVYAVIVGSAINQDGRTVGMTVPSASAQEAMVREALGERGHRRGRRAVRRGARHRHAGRRSASRQRRSSAVLREGARPGDACAMGSVKTNIGHLEAAAGIAGLIKTALCDAASRDSAVAALSTRRIPSIDFDGGRLRVVTALEPWPDRRGPRDRRRQLIRIRRRERARACSARRRVAASSGAARTAIRRHASLAAAQRAQSARRSPTLARALCRAARRRRWPGVRATSPTAAAHAARASRAPHRDRRADARGSCGRARGVRSPASAAPRRDAAAARARGKLAFVFSGMGPQWWGMGQQLRARRAGVPRDARALS